MADKANDDAERLSPFLSSDVIKGIRRGSISKVDDGSLSQLNSKGSDKL